MEQYKREFIQFLEGAGVLKFGDFTAKSGRKIPYFINAGDIKTGDQIAKLGEFYAKSYLEKVGKKRCVLFGPAYKGISIAVSASVALSKEGLDVPFFFDRKEVKDHGEGGMFVGYTPKAGRSRYYRRRYHRRYRDPRKHGQAVRTGRCQCRRCLCYGRQKGKGSDRKVRNGRDHRYIRLPRLLCC